MTYIPSLSSIPPTLTVVSSVRPKEEAPFVGERYNTKYSLSASSIMSSTRAILTVICSVGSSANSSAGKVMVVGILEKSVTFSAPSHPTVCSKVDGENHTQYISTRRTTVFFCFLFFFCKNIVLEQL